MYALRPELGIKRLCVRCAVRFYDLQRQPAQCPACDAVQPPPAPRNRAVPRPAGTRWQGRSGAREAVPALEVAGEGGVPLLESPESVEDDDETDPDAEVADEVEEDERE